MVEQTWHRDPPLGEQRQPEIQIWDLWYPNAAARGLPFARGRLDATGVLLVHASPDTLDVEVSPATIWRRAPVLDAIRVTRPTIELGRNADGTYDIQDLIDAWFKPSTDPTPLFSLNNIEIDGGALSLDDRMRKNKVALSNLAVGIPFLSSLPHEAEIRVNPRLEGVLEGAHFMLKGTASTPFADRKEATLDVDFDALSLLEIAQYVPLPHGLKLKDGALTTRLKLAFVSERGEPRAVTLSGVVRLDRPSVTRADDSAFAAARSAARPAASGR